MELVLRVNFKTQIKHLRASCGEFYTIGSSLKDHIQVESPALRRGAYRVTVNDTGWTLMDRSGKNVWSQDFGQILVLDNETHLAVSVYRTSAAPVCIMDLAGEDKLLIGRSEECDLVIRDKQVSGKHLELRKKGDDWEFRDTNSRNGTYLNGELCGGSLLSSGDELVIGHSIIRFSSSQLSVFLHGKAYRRVRETTTKTADTSDTEYPYFFKQSPRLIEEVPMTKVELQAPPNIGGKPQISWLGVILTPLLTMSVMVIVGLLIMNTTTMLYFSVPMSLISILTGVLRYRSDKKKHKKMERLRIEKYGEYLMEQVHELERLSYTQRAVLENAAPATAKCVRIAAGTDRTLWDRRVRDVDFLSLRVGSGILPASFTIDAPKQLLSLETDILAEQPAQIVERFETVSECPINMELGTGLSCGIIGTRSKCVTEGKNLVVQAAVHHSYDDLRIVVLCDSEERSQWAFCRWLPHCYDDSRSIRYIADDRNSALKLLSHMETIISGRITENAQLAYGSARAKKPFYLFVCATPDLIMGHPVMKYLEANDPALGIGAIYLFDRMADLPKDCYYILDFMGTANLFYERRHASFKQKFQIDPLPNEHYDVFARALAPVRVESTNRSASLPKAISFLQGYKTTMPQALPLAENWANACPERGMAVPIGVRAGGDPFLFDIHEKQHGPHGLVAGMTGSGKSEMVQSWILSMAVRFPPEAVSFVLIDFKGTGLLLPFKKLPHLAGCISDLDTSIGRNLIALENELTRRKALLDRYQVSNISAYLKLLREGKTTEPLSYLFIVIDEFAEFKNRFPDFMVAVNRVFAIGRTLGVHMILLTQKPANIVDDKMNANTRFRWCLKVASSADSREMLRHNDAARITNPGRAYVQVGEDEVYEEIQSYWSGAPFNPYRDLSLQRTEKVSVVDLYGNRMNYEQEKTMGYQAEKNEINAIVDHLDDYCKKNGVEKAKQLWTTKLPSVLRLKDVIKTSFDGERWQPDEPKLSPAVGLIDDPKTQSQYPLHLSFTEEGHYAIYGAPGTGKTTLLHTAIMSMALSCTPQQVHMYLMDFGGGSLNLFRDLPHVGGVVLSDDETRMEKLTAMLLEELDRRKKLISGHGLVNISSYREATGDMLPYIVLILDNFAPVLDLYPNLDTFFQSIARDGSSCGIYFLVATGTQNSLNYRISQNIKAALCMRMSDKGDYASIVGRTNGLEPENHPGRGLVKGNPPLEFQIALPANQKSEVQRVNEIRETAKLMQEHWEADCAPAIPVMPEIVQSEQYHTKDLLCGLFVQSVQPCTVDLTDAQYLLLSNGVGDSSTRIAVMKQVLQKIPLQSVIAMGEHKLPGMELLDAAGFDRQIEQLMPVLQQRKENSNGQKLDAEQWPYILVYIEDLKQCIDSIADQTLRRLSSIVTLGGGLNVLVVAEGSADTIAKFYNTGESFTMNMSNKAVSLLLGGSGQLHMGVKTDMPYSLASAPLDRGEGYCVRNGHAEKIKAVQQ